MLLGVTAILSGLTIPLILAYISARDAEYQTQADAARTRNETLVRASETLLSEFSSVAMTYQTLALDVSFPDLNRDQHQAAIQRYASRIVDLWSQWRALASRARYLASRPASVEMEGLLRCVYRQDQALVALANQSDPPPPAA
jgi:hypothetical protein